MDWNWVFSSIASFVSRTITYPMDSIKTIQMNSNTIPRGSGIKTIRILYRGLGITLLFSIPATSIYLNTYDRLAKEKNVKTIAFSAAIAEASAGLIYTPMEVVKQKLQVSNTKLKDIVKDVINNHGLRGFYRGYFLTQVVFVPYTVTYFLCYENLKKIWLSNNSDLNIPSYAFLSFLSAAGFCF